MFVCISLPLLKLQFYSRLCISKFQKVFKIPRSALIQHQQSEDRVRQCDVQWLCGCFMSSVFMSRERPGATCSSLSNNLVGCVIDRNGLRWAFNRISAMKETEDRQWWAKGNRTVWYPSAQLGETASFTPPPPTSLSPFSCFRTNTFPDTNFLTGWTIL